MSFNWISNGKIKSTCPHCQEENWVVPSDWDFEIYAEDTGENGMGGRYHYRTDMEVTCVGGDHQYVSTAIVTEYPDGCLECVECSKDLVESEVALLAEVTSK